MFQFPAKILITGSLHPLALEGLSERSDLMIENHPDCTKELLFEKVKTCQVLITRSETVIDKTLIDSAPNLKLIARAAVGVANIDIDYATSKGILVINTPGKNTNSAAELAMGWIVSLCRRLVESNHHIKQGIWERQKLLGCEVRGKDLGLVGLGHVGHRVAKFANGFDMNVFGYDPYVSDQVFARHNVTRVSSLEELCEKVQILTVHVPLNGETQSLVKLKHLALLKEPAFVVNSARGGIIDEEDLLQALEQKIVGGCAIDTWQKEPHINRRLADHALSLGSPHVGASTKEAQKAIAKSVVQQVCKALDGVVVDHPVNLPEVGPLDSPQVRSYALLGEKLGSLASQMIGFSPSHIELGYRGDLVHVEPGLIRLSFMKGYASNVSDEYVSYVNVENVFSKLGLAVEEVTDPSFSSYKSALKVRFVSPEGQSLVLGGIVFDEEHLRLSLINSFEFEVDPKGNFLLVNNDDQPGVIGAVGSLLAKHQINIDSFDLSRDRKGGKAMALVRIDGGVHAPLLQSLSELEHVNWVKKASL